VGIGGVKPDDATALFKNPPDHADTASLTATAAASD
jgi:hypothetical protein